jgi:hypothetical protein
MRTKATIILFFAITLSIVSCKKSTDKNDLTTDIVGRYTNASESTEITVNKVSNTSVSISLTTGTGSGRFTVAFTNTTMNSTTSFTLNTVDRNSALCDGTESITGTGTSTGNNISLFIKDDVKGTLGSISACPNFIRNVNVSATK